MSRVRAAIVGLSGPVLLAEEAALFRRLRPAGAILFARNVQNPAQLASLTAAIREELGADAPILVDQEGGRVARLKPPHWPAFPPAAVFEHHNVAAAEANATLLAMECVAAGLDVVCAPVLDLRLSGAHEVVGDRGFSADPAEVARLAEGWVRGLQSGGAIPVLKHMPGHGQHARGRTLIRRTANPIRRDRSFPHRISSTGVTPITARPERMTVAVAATRASRARVASGCSA
jgi:beta-N-acetylhexosaminidase